MSVDATQPGNYINRLNCPDDRWKRLAIELRPWKTSNVDDQIFVCSSSKRDFKYHGMRLATELPAVEMVLKYHTTRQIILRRKNGMGAPRPALRKLFPTSHAIVTWTSISAVEAVIAGVPAFALGRESAASPIASHDLTMIETPLYPDRTQWSYNLTYQQWTLDELGTGEPFSFLQSTNLI